MSISRSSKRPEGFLDPDRIRIARTRRGLTKADLARLLAVTPRTITRYESDGAPTATSAHLAQALEFAESYFTSAGAPELDVARVSFRAARRATARSRHAAVAAGTLGIEIDQWISRRYTMPTVMLPTYSGEGPTLAARLLRAEWALGTRPLPNAIQLAESRGVRVYTLAPIAEDVDAYSTWHGDTPYIFLSRRRSPERMRFDVAHELGHLVLHAAAGCDDQSHEREADAFASELLIPRDSLPEHLRKDPTCAEILDVRSRFKMSAMALAFAAHKAGRMTDWTYRQLCIELSGRGYGSTEHGGMPAHEMSRVFPQILGSGPGKVTARQIAAELSLPAEDVRSMTFGVELHTAHERADSPASASAPSIRTHPHLKVV
ncbi:XRE family transcriptional regulator [Tomitella cavernea]|uniref:ImmA/IrrE family metallo-endopeptidase n=1 Tax=Tomitella cavernea TaxID=1387982 RepID=A0ABP9CNN7_9ACTN|nr:XRE family transcriptional regulator [Tomitella cavernea]